MWHVSARHPAGARTLLLRSSSSTLLLAAVVADWESERVDGIAQQTKAGALGKAKGYIKGLIPGRVESKRKAKRRKQLDLAHQLAKKRSRVADGVPSVSALSCYPSNPRTRARLRLAKA